MGFSIAWSLRPARRRSLSSVDDLDLEEKNLQKPSAYLMQAFVPLVNRLRGPNLIAVLGLVIVLLSDTLKVIAESNLGYR